ncbi:hypothetical protein KC909_07000, partial [Candidatus Dojkabacteria bacterium]|nr:hypothetical protein [Candidatus Dojkabacteria bacterium]
EDGNNCRDFTRGLIGALDEGGYDSEILAVSGILENGEKWVHEVVITNTEPPYVIEPQTGQTWLEPDAEVYFASTYKLRNVITVALGKYLR